MVFTDLRSSVYYRTIIELCDQSIHQSNNVWVLIIDSSAQHKHVSITGWGVAWSRQDVLKD